MTRKLMHVWIGFDPREANAFAVARDSLRLFDRHIPIEGLVLSDLQANGLYDRPTERRLGRLYDKISEHEMATEFAISRFLIPELVRQRNKDWHAGGWHLFTDCDVMWRAPPSQLRELLDDEKALMCVKHNFNPTNTTKMDGQVQSQYNRKNWSSVMAFNCDHESNKKLTVELVNTVPGRDLHRFCWLEDDEIGELPPEWNYLVGHTKLDKQASLVHFTDGIPGFEAFRDCEYSAEWFDHLYRWAA